MKHLSFWIFIAYVVDVHCFYLWSFSSLFCNRIPLSFGEHILCGYVSLVTPPKHGEGNIIQDGPKFSHLPGPCDWLRNKSARLKPGQEESPLKLFFWSYQKRPILLGLIGWWDIRWGYGEPSDLPCSHWLLLWMSWEVTGQKCTWPYICENVILAAV